MSAFGPVLPAICNLNEEAVVVPIPSESPVVVRYTVDPPSVKPGSVLLMVIFLSVVLVENVIPVPAASSSVSVLEPAVILSLPAFIVLKMYWEEPRSVLVIVGVWPLEIETPVPAVIE